MQATAALPLAAANGGGRARCGPSRVDKEAGAIAAGTRIQDRWWGQ